jgi:hypothetical protein
MFSSLVHLILSLSISYPYLIKFHYFADNSQEGTKHQMRGATLPQQGHDFRDNSTMSIKYRVSAFHIFKIFITLRIPLKDGFGVKGGPKTDNSIVWIPL